MRKWTDAANRRLNEIHLAEEGANDMRIIATAMGHLPPGQLKKVLTDEIIAIMAKYGVVIE